MINAVDIFTNWHWLILAAILAGAEMLVPGYFMIWIGAAAALTGIFSWIMPNAWPLQVLVFSVLALGAVVIARRYMRQNPVITEDANLNRRADRMLGSFVIVVEPIVNGQGKVKVGDSPWIAKGPDSPVGAQMRITKVEGSWLIVEPV